MNAFNAYCVHMCWKLSVKWSWKSHSFVTYFRLPLRPNKITFASSYPWRQPGNGLVWLTGPPSHALWFPWWATELNFNMAWAESNLSAILTLDDPLSFQTSKCYFILHPSYTNIYIKCWWHKTAPTTPPPYACFLPQFNWYTSKKIVV